MKHIKHWEKYGNKKISWHVFLEKENHFFHESYRRTLTQM